MTLNELLTDQLDFHWTHQLHPRLSGLTDEEYLWEPVPGSWSVRPSATGAVAIDWAWPEPVPAPMTTIAWRLAHVIVACLAMRSASHFGRPAVDYESFAYAGTAAEALRQLSWRFGHIRQAKTGILDAFFLRYQREAEGRKPFLDWVREDYDETALKRDFHANGLASFINDWVLAHE